MVTGVTNELPSSKVTSPTSPVPAPTGHQPYWRNPGLSSFQRTDTGTSPSMDRPNGRNPGSWAIPVDDSAPTPPSYPIDTLPSRPSVMADPLISGNSVFI